MPIPVVKLPGQKLLHVLFDYEPSTGRLIWRCGRRRGLMAGSVNANGYLLVGIKIGERVQLFYAQRLIWKWMTGQDPVDQIDHADGDKLNNCWSNLRSASRGQNLYNSKLRSDNPSGVKGVRLTRDGRWLARITVNGEQLYLGLYDSIELAAKAVKQARSKMHGKFARLK